MCVSPIKTRKKQIKGKICLTRNSTQQSTVKQLIKAILNHTHLGLLTYLKGVEEEEEEEEKMKYSERKVH